MKTFFKITGSVVLFALFVIIVTGSQVQLAFAQTSSPSSQSKASFCPKNGPFGNTIYTSTSTFQKGATVSFCLVDGGRVPLFYGSAEHPWIILNGKNEVIFQPQSIAPTTQPTAAMVFVDSWNQRDNHGKKVPKGKYKIVFSDTPYSVAPAVITVVGK